jgi:hypothetical protein
MTVCDPTDSDLDFNLMLETSASDLHNSVSYISLSYSSHASNKNQTLSFL